jgi:hypothetical protein
MKPTTRATLAALVTGVAAVGTAAAPAAAAASAHVPVPLDGVSRSLGTRTPEAGPDVVPVRPGTTDGPRSATGRRQAERTVPRGPVHTARPGAGLRAPLPRVLDERSAHVGLDAPVTGLRPLGPGRSADAPRTAPDPDDFGLPGVEASDVADLAPVLRSATGIDLGMRPDL